MKHQQPLIALVDKIFSSTGNDYTENSAKQAKVKEYERQIDPVRSGTSCYDTSNGVDQMVYKFYGLTEKEIRIIEGEN